MIYIREAVHNDFEYIWPIFHQVVTVGGTYPYPPDTTKEQAYTLWMDAPLKTYIAEKNGEILATYYLKTNQPGAGKHVCNCGYMVLPKAQGKGLATAMCQHSQQQAIALGYKAMQFNLVVSSNEIAVRLWNKLGFSTVGCLPKAFNHPQLGYVDALIMYKWLE